MSVTNGGWFIALSIKEKSVDTVQCSCGYDIDHEENCVLEKVFTRTNLPCSSRFLTMVPVTNLTFVFKAKENLGCRLFSSQKEEGIE